MQTLEKPLETVESFVLPDEVAIPTVEEVIHAYLYTGIIPVTLAIYFERKIPRTAEIKMFGCALGALWKYRMEETPDNGEVFYEKNKDYLEKMVGVPWTYGIGFDKGLSGRPLAYTYPGQVENSVVERSDSCIIKLGHEHGRGVRKEVREGILSHLR
jgi:hypothetical protein